MSHSFLRPPPAHRSLTQYTTRARKQTQSHTHASTANTPTPVYAHTHPASIHAPMTRTCIASQDDVLHGPRAGGVLRKVGSLCGGDALQRQRVHHTALRLSCRVCSVRWTVSRLAQVSETERLEKVIILSSQQYDSFQKLTSARYHPPAEFCLLKHPSRILL